MNPGQALDREAMLNDIELLTGKRPAATRYDERKWSIVLPSELTRLVTALPGVRIGRRIEQPPALPAFVLQADCPVAVVRSSSADSSARTDTGRHSTAGARPITRRA